MSIASKFDIGLYSDNDVRDLLAHARALEAMLKKHEWSGVGVVCRECGGDSVNDGHKRDCELAKLLEGLES